jgi:mono/diheme cytochrome c family protein
MNRKTVPAALAAISVLIGLAACSKKEAAEPEAKADPKLEQVIKGQYLTAAGDCYACHTVRGGEPYSGGLEMATPFGALYTPNITPDKETGIGTWTADDFWRAMHEGKSKDGSFMYPAMPYTNYTKVTREDSDAIFAYMMSVKPVSRKNREHAMGFPFNQRELMAGWRALYFTSGEFKENPKESKEWNRGAYLVEGLGHCNACHATRNMLGAIAKDDDYSGGLIPLQNWYAPSLTSSRETGLGDWDLKEIVDLLRNGVAARGAVFGPMAAVVQHSLQELSMTDLTAMAVYLKVQSEKAAPAPLLAAHELSAGEAALMMNTGAKIYKDQCASCHQEDGKGVPRVYPPLATNQAITMKTPVNAIRIILNGGFPPSTEGNPRPYGMPPFSQLLSDQEVASLTTYIRNSWGNSAAPTWSVEVGQVRGVPVD